MISSFERRIGCYLGSSASIFSISASEFRSPSIQVCGHDRHAERTWSARPIRSADGTIFAAFETSTMLAGTIRQAANGAAVVESATILLNPGWNLVSAPLTLLQPATSLVFPTSDQVMALVDVDRAQTDTIEVGSRYWVFHSRDATSVTVFGEWPSGSVSVDPGWNIVGFGVTQAVPPGAIARAQNGDRHETVDVLEEAGGYWIYSEQPLTISL